MQALVMSRQRPRMKNEKRKLKRIKLHGAKEMEMEEPRETLAHWQKLQRRFKAKAKADRFVALASSQGPSIFQGNGRERKIR